MRNFYIPNIFGDLPLLIFHVRIHSCMHIPLIIHRTHWMLVSHCIVERTQLSSQIHSIFQLSFSEMQRVNIIGFHQPLCMIHEVMRMPMNFWNFLIVVVVITLLLHLIMMMTHALLVFLSHPSSLIYLFDEMETPQDVKALQLELMVISGPRCLEVNSTIDQKLYETPKAPHHSLIYIEDQSNSQSSHSPL